VARARACRHGQWVAAVGGARRQGAAQQGMRRTRHAACRRTAGVGKISPVGCCCGTCAEQGAEQSHCRKVQAAARRQPRRRHQACRARREMVMGMEEREPVAARGSHGNRPDLCRTRPAETRCRRCSLSTPSDTVHRSSRVPGCASWSPGGPDASSPLTPTWCAGTLPDADRRQSCSASSVAQRLRGRASSSPVTGCLQTSPPPLAGSARAARKMPGAND
jgi:hypothetical protein